MQDDKNHISFTAEDIRKYHEGKLTPKQMHELEKASLEDPFLADALEGYAVDEVRVPADIDELKRRLQERIADKKVIPIAAPSKRFNWLRVAAMIVAIGGAGLLVYNFGFNRNEKSIAQQVTTTKSNEPTNAAPADSAIPQTKMADSAVAANKAPEAAKSTGLISIEKEVADKKVAQADAEVLEAKERSEYKALAKPAAVATAPAKALSDDNLDKTLAGRVPGVSVSKDNMEESRAIVADSISLNRNFFAAESAKKEGQATFGYSTQAKQKTTDQSLGRSRREQAMQASPNIFRGKVTDAQNNPLPFANITNSNDNVGTYADAQGNFILTSPDSTMDVQVKSLGFENSNIQLQNGLVTNRVMMKDDKSIAAIVLSNKKVNAKLRENNMVLEEPEPADGWTKYDAYLANNLNLPDDYKGGQKQGGEVALSFEVNQLGEPINIKVEKSLCEICDKEAIRLLKEGPKWKRKAKKGKRTSITIPF